MDKKSKSHPFSILSLLVCAKCNSTFFDSYLREHCIR